MFGSSCATPSTFTTDGLGGAARASGSSSKVGSGATGAGAPAEVAPGGEADEVREETPPEGLSSDAVRIRVEQGLTNAAEQRTSRTFTEIVRANVLTRFNAILGTMLVLILIVGPFQDALFGVVLVANALIGIVQEWRAKKALDHLAVLNAPMACVVRDGESREIPVDVAG